MRQQDQTTVTSRIWPTVISVQPDGRAPEVVHAPTPPRCLTAPTPGPRIRPWSRWRARWGWSGRRSLHRLEAASENSPAAQGGKVEARAASVRRHSRSAAKVGWPANSLARSCSRRVVGQLRPARRTAPAGSPSLRGPRPWGRRRGRHLNPALGVDVEAVLLGVGRARQDDVGAVGALVAVRAQIDDEGVARPKRRSRRRPAGTARPRPPRSRPCRGGLAALARHEAQVEPADAAAAVCSTFKPFQPPTPRRARRQPAALTSTPAPSARAERPAR
jgi:hypothetical protein